MTSYTVYKIYIGLRTHFFTKRYDYFLSNKRTKANRESFEKRDDKYFFENISKKYSTIEDVELLFAANMVSGVEWIGTIASEEGRDNYLKRKRVLEALEYTLKQDFDYLFDNYPFQSLFDCTTGHPPLFKQYMAGSIQIESFIAIDMVLNFVPRFDKSIKEKLIWPDIRDKCQKYCSFIRINKEFVRRELRNRFLPDEKRA